MFTVQRAAQRSAPGSPIDPAAAVLLVSTDSVQPALYDNTHYGLRSRLGKFAGCCRVWHWPWSWAGWCDHRKTPLGVFRRKVKGAEVLEELRNTESGRESYPLDEHLYALSPDSSSSRVKKLELTRISVTEMKCHG